MRKTLILIPLLFASLLKAEESNVKQIILPNGEKRVVYLNAKERYTAVDESINLEYKKKKAEDNTWRKKTRDEKTINSIFSGAGAILGAKVGMATPTGPLITSVKFSGYGASIGKGVSYVYNKRTQKEEEKRLINERKEQIKKDKETAREYDRNRRKRKD